VSVALRLDDCHFLKLLFEMDEIIGIQSRRITVANIPESVIVQDPDILGGEPVFRGTRVPFKTLFDYLEGGDTLDEFLEQ
jgi:hypothetical protein